MKVPPSCDQYDSAHHNLRWPSRKRTQPDELKAKTEEKSTMANP